MVNSGGLHLKYTFKDRVILGGIAGTLAIITRDVWSFLSKMIGFAKFYVWQRSADLFIEDGKALKSFIGNMVGFLADMVFGAMLGILFVYLLKATNQKSIIIKGWIFGIIAWLFLFGMLVGNLPGSQSTAPKDALSNISAFIGHSIYGISLGIYAQFLLKKFQFLPDGWRRGTDSDD